MADSPFIYFQKDGDMFPVLSKRNDGYAPPVDEAQLLGVITLLPGPANVEEVGWSRNNKADNAVCELIYLFFTTFTAVSAVMYCKQLCQCALD